ncbi:Holliday junction resolvase RuvX [Psychrobium sp. 1_MG-2023]|uniref:Holliday junction resolvase RuvX n=1 Tax=Psychrobium sp. 1_MG-2023 TaxID=3062624 RepID=UPI000C349B7D|nr:Holliday junction resolvase RuvX [Psychrobium sp. 1_MG-2023]MDP2562375.1 Holliday junction resolvase RuvX [Psychrobium sp. 1_MG-2023]PKF55859.1 Holliday junction resolvase RuvX [Alteromonadales bacterium alter-6D02]
MTCIIAFDYGVKSIGVAVGQQITGTASPLAAIKATNGIPNWDDLDKLVQEWQPSQFVVGFPTNMDGSDQEITLRARKFAKRLYARFKLSATGHDERLTTAEAKERLFELGGYKKLTKGKIDSVSAVLILESWFTSQYEE